MSDIDIHARHDMNHDDAQHAADELAADLAERFAINYGWDGDVIVFERPGVHGQILVQNSEIRVTARLGFLLMFLKPRIEEEVVRYLSDHFGCTFSS
jgi:putative polyhydroxyalkanoate system protein